MTLLLLAGDTLEMNLNLNDFSNSLTFKGKRAEINNKLHAISSGKPAPGFSLKNTRGDIVSLTDFKGKY